MVVGVIGEGQHWENQPPEEIITDLIKRLKVKNATVMTTNSGLVSQLVQKHVNAISFNANRPFLATMVDILVVISDEPQPLTKHLLKLPSKSCIIDFKGKEIWFKNESAF